MQKRTEFDVSDLAVLAVAVSLEVVLSRFLSIPMWNMKFGFSFLAVAFAARRCGLLGGAIVGGLSDAVGALLFPIGPYYPLISLVAALNGAVFGLFLRRGQAARQVLPAVLITQIGGSLGLNTLFISWLYSAPYLPLLATRALQTAVMIPIELAVLLLLGRSKAYAKLINIGR